jgi:hypothetical protein
MGGQKLEVVVNKAEEPMGMIVFKAVILCIVLAITIAIAGVSCTAACESAATYRSGAETMSLPSLSELISLVWLGVRIFFWAVVTALASLASILTLGACGVLVMIFQKLGTAAGYVMLGIQSQWGRVLKRQSPVQLIVARDAAGNPVTIQQVMAKYQDNFNKLSKKVRISLEDK